LRAPQVLEGKLDCAAGSSASVASSFENQKCCLHGIPLRFSRERMTKPIKELILATHGPRLGLLILLIAPVISAQKVSTTFDGNFSFSEHKRYAWRENRLMTRQHPDTNELMDLKIVKTVNEALAVKNFEETKDHPDFYIHYDGGGNMDVLAGSPERANSTALSPTDRTPTYGLGNGPALAPATWLKVNGEIVFHITDAESKKVVWETTYKKTFRDPNKALRNWDKVVDELVAKSFKDFPPKNKK
jgi:hypothetical protein